MTTTDLDNLKLELSIKAKNGVDFISAACIVWLLIAYVWTLPFSSYDKSVLTFIIGSLLLPLALLLSKVLKTTWTVKNNPLQPLGLWLNFAQLFYFPFLVFVLLRQPDYFVMTYAIITGAHFFPYAWYYKEIGFAVMAGVISVGSLLLSLSLTPEQMYLVPLAMAGALGLLAVWIYGSFSKKLNASKTA
jgi:hypothetical protein